MSVLSFKPNIVVDDLLSVLKERNKDIISQRFGIGRKEEGKTLEEIGKKYGITRERVRQIINFSLNTIKENPIMERRKEAFEELKDNLEKRGKILSERDVLEHFSPEPISQRYIYFLLVLGDEFKKFKEDEEFNHRWTIDEEFAHKVHNVLRDLHKEIREEDVIPEQEILNILNKKIENIVRERVNEEILKLWLRLSRLIANNPMGEWGLVSSPHINPRGVRDLIYLVMRKQKEPMHFTEAAEKIKEYFSKKVHLATVHNELIKDPRFVLVGRGLYALKDWGYRPGITKEIIENIIRERGPLTKEEIVEAVLKERHIKENTILINLHNRKYFRRDKDGRYAII